MILTIPIPLAKEAAPKVRSDSYADGMAVLESLERLVKSTSSALLPKKRASATRQMLPHVSLEEQTLKVLVFPLAKIRHISESTKYSESALSQKMEHLPFCGQTLLNHQLWRASNNLLKIIIRHKDTHLFRNCKFHSSSVQTVLPEPIRSANPTFAVPNPHAKPFGSANSHFPYRILMRRHSVRQTAISRTKLWLGGS